MSTITVQVASESVIDQAIQEIADLLRTRHRVTEDDFVISSQRDFLNTITQVTGVFTAFLGAVAGISLSIPSVVSPDAVALAFSVSAAVGLFFGIYPAMRASRLNPIDALRWE